MPPKKYHFKQRYVVGFVVIASLVFVAPLADASRAKAIREAVEYASRKFSKEVAEEGVESLASKLSTQAAKHGDEAITAFRKVGPRSLRLIEEAGDEGTKVVRLMARIGDEAVWVVSKPNRLAIFVRFGDDAADAMAKHKGIAEGLIDDLGLPAAKALKSIDGQNARRLAMMNESGELAKMSRPRALLETVGRYGDKAADFVWRNKGALATTAALGAFLNDPRPFIDGAKDIAVETAKGPITEVARHTNWTMVGITGLVLLVLCAFAHARRRRRILGRKAPRDEPLRELA